MGSSLYNVMLCAVKAAASYGAEDFAARSATRWRTGRHAGAAETEEAYDSIAKAAA
jgi:hypothetical protein